MSPREIIRRCHPTLSLAAVKVHPHYDKFTEERVFKVRLKSEEVAYTKDRAMKVELGFLIQSSGIGKGEILHITSATRLVTTVNSVHLTP